MVEDSDSECSFTIEEMRRDDPRLRQFLEIPEEAKQSLSTRPFSSSPAQMTLRLRTLVFGISAT